MTDSPPEISSRRSIHKHRVTRIEICDSGNTNIVIVNKCQCSSNKPTFDFVKKKEKNPCCQSKYINILVNRRKRDEERKCNKRRTRFVTTDDYLRIMAKKRSTPDVHLNAPARSMRKQRSDTYLRTSTSFRLQCIINTVMLHPTTVSEDCLHLLRHPLVQAQLRIYRHHFKEKDETCLRSQSMTKLIKTLYNNHERKRFKQFNYYQYGHWQLEKQLLNKPSKIPKIDVRETQVSMCIDTFAATKKSEQEINNVEMVLNTMQKQDILDCNADFVDITEKSTTNIPEIAVTKTQENIYINELAATKISEQKMKKVEITNIDSLQREQTDNDANSVMVQENNLTMILKNNIRQIQDNLPIDSISGYKKLEPKFKNPIKAKSDTFQTKDTIEFATCCKVMIEDGEKNKHKTASTEIQDTIARKKMEQGEATNFHAQVDGKFYCDTNCKLISETYKAIIPETYNKKIHYSTSIDFFSEITEQKVEQVEINIDTSDKEAKRTYIENLENSDREIPDIDTIFIDTIIYSKISKQEIEPLEITYLDTLQKEDGVNNVTKSTNNQDSNAKIMSINQDSNYYEVPDSKYIDIFIATKIPEQNTDKVIKTNTLQKKETIAICSKTEKEHNNNDISGIEYVKRSNNIISNFKVTTFDVLQKKKSTIKTGNMFHRTLSLDDVLLYQRNLLFYNENNRVHQKRSMVNPPTKQTCPDYQETKIHIIKSEKFLKSKMSAGNKTLIAVNKETFEIFSKERRVRSALSLETSRESIKQTYNRHCSLQNLKTISKRFHAYSGDFIFSSPKEMNAVELTIVTKSQKNLVNTTIIGQSEPSPLIKEKNLNKPNDKIDKKIDDVKTAIVAPVVEENITNMSIKQKRNTLIPRPKKRTILGNKDAEMKKNDHERMSTSSKATSSKAENAKRQTIIPLNYSQLKHKNTGHVQVINRFQTNNVSNESKFKSLKQSMPPLDGKSPSEKEKILRALLRKGKSLPEGRTKAEKALIDKIRNEIQSPSYFAKSSVKKV